MKRTQIAGNTAKAEKNPSAVRALGGGKSPAQKQKVGHTADPDFYHHVRIGAYFRAERRGFEPGAELQDWFEAEQEIRHLQNVATPADSAGR